METIDQKSKLGWSEGTLVEGDLARINQLQPQSRSWKVERFLGSGFSAGVFAAEDQVSGQQVVLRVYRLPSKLKGAIRTSLHRQASGLPFPHVYLEHPHLIAEGLDDILARAIKIEGIERVNFPQTLGHFYHQGQRSFVGVHERVSPEKSLPPIANSQGEEDYLLKTDKSKQVYELANRIGAIDLARQWDLSTLHAITNSAVILNDGQRVVSMIDSRQGLPILNGLPLSPGDIPRAFNPVRVDKPYFDQVDFEKLEEYFALHSTEMQDLVATLLNMREIEREYRDCLPKPVSIWRYQDARRRRLIRETAARAFLVDGYVDEETAAQIRSSDLAAGTNLILHNSSEAGPLVQRVVFNRGFREKLKSAPSRLGEHLRDRRRNWLKGVIERSFEEGEVSGEVRDQLLAQSQESRVDLHVKDALMTTAGFGLVGLAISPIIAEAARASGYQHMAEYSVAQMFPLVVKVSYGSVMRAAYLFGRVAKDRFNPSKNDHKLLPLPVDLLIAGASVVSPFGNAAVPLRMISEYPVLSGVLASHFLDKVVRKVPVFGGRGSILERWLYQLSYNWLARKINGHNKLSPEVVDNKEDHRQPQQDGGEDRGIS